MANKLRFVALALAVMPVFLSCNIYQPFSSPSSEDELIEEARWCLHGGDYACAIAAYGKLPDGEVKNEKLCIVNVARAGLDLGTLVEIVTNGNSGQAFLSNMAESLIPFTDDKLAGAEAAVTACALMPATDTGRLLKTLSLLSDCAVRIARTDSQVATIDGGLTECNATIAGNGDGEITQADIGGDDVTGTLSVAKPGMCSGDVRACVNDLAAAEGAGFSGITDNLDALPAELQDTGEATDVIRLTLKGTIVE